MKIRLFVFAASALIAQSVAHAGIVTISGSGTWGPDAPISIYTAPGESWSFSFELPDPLDATFTSTATNFQYFLNGTAVSTTLSSVEFFDQAQGGMFDLNFADGNSLNLYGDQVFSSPSLSLVPGVYSINIDINAFTGPPDGNGAGTLTIALAVPEPSSIVSGGLGLLALAGLAVRSMRGSVGCPLSRRFSSIFRPQNQERSVFPGPLVLIQRRMEIAKSLNDLTPQ